ncbi:MAG: tetratricopeptide repeat protein [Acidobacteriota bacterium]
MLGYWFFLPLFFLTAVSLRAEQAETLPNLPTLDLERFEPVIRNEIAKAQERAQSDALDANVVGRLGMLLHAHDQYEAAAPCYERAHRLQPQEFKWSYYLGLTQIELARTEEALASLSHALKLEPDYLPAQLKLAQTLLATGNVKESRQAYQVLAERFPEAPEVHYGLGQAASAEGNSAGALEHYRKASQLDPEFGSAHYALALALRSLGGAEDAEKHMALYKKYRGQVPAHDSFVAELHRLRAGSREHLEQGLKLQQEGKIEEAVQAYKRVLEADPERVQAHINLLSAYLSWGKLEEAEKHYQEAVRINPNAAEAHYNYGLLLSRQGREADAAEAFRKALMINPHYAEAHNNLGHALFREKKWQEAEDHFRQAVESRPDYRIARYNLARLLLNRGDLEGAIGHLLRIISVEDSQTPLYLYILADACARAGRLREAIGYAVKAKDMAKSLGQTELAARIEKELREAQRATKTELRP